MTNDKTTPDSSENRRTEQDLDRQYGRIAISAVAAALPYHSESMATEASAEEQRNGRRKHREA